jgi:hypothetical protein
MATMALSYDSCDIKEVKNNLAIRYINTEKTTDIYARTINCKDIGKFRSYKLCEIENNHVTYKVLGDCKEIVRMHNGTK